MKCVVVGDRYDSYPRRLAEELKSLFVPVEFKEYKAREIKPIVDIGALGAADAYGRAALLFLREGRQNPDANAYEKKLALTANALMNIDQADALSCTAAAVPYLFYARQDRAFMKGEAESLRQTAESVERYADVVFTYNSHISGRPGRSMQQYFNRAVVEDISMAAPLAAPLKAEYGVRRPLIVNPDDEHPERLGDAMSQFEGSEFGYVIQDRDPLSGKKVVVGSKLDARGKTVVVYDDLTESAGTLTRAVDEVRKQSPAEIYIIVPHMFTSEPMEKLGRLVKDGAVRAVLTTDSFADSDDSCARNGITVVDTTKFVANYISEYEY